MNTRISIKEQVLDRRLELELEEFAKRTTPPDCRLEILARADAAPVDGAVGWSLPSGSNSGGGWGRGVQQFTAAALVLLAVGVTATVFFFVAGDDPVQHQPGSARVASPSVQRHSWAQLQSQLQGQLQGRSKAKEQRQGPDQGQGKGEGEGKAGRQDQGKGKKTGQNRGTGKKTGQDQGSGQNQDKSQRRQKGSQQGKDPIPKGTDPADIAAIKSAKAMIEAEKRLAKMLKSGEIKGIDQVLRFEKIGDWPYENGLDGIPDKVKAIDGTTVLMTGFMLPIDEVEDIKEFLLVQSLWSCCYGQPPDINGTVRVVVKGGERLDYKFEPIKVIGKFKIKATVEDGFCVDIYQLETDNVEVIK